jgi:hypothetical protein
MVILLSEAKRETDVRASLWRFSDMKKILYLFVLMVTAGPSAVLGAESPERMALLIDNAGAEWEVTDLYAWTNPGPFIESRFRLAVATDTFHVAIPPENLISIEKKGENFEIRYRWMGRDHVISGTITSDQIGGKLGGGFTYVKIHDLERLTFKEGSAGIEEEKPPSHEYETTLLLNDGTKVPVAHLVRVSAQTYSAVPLSGVEEVTVFEPLNDVAFLQEKNAPTIRFRDIRSMEFPNENTIILTLRRDSGIPENQGKGAGREKPKATVEENGEIDEDFEFLKGDLGDLDIDFGADEGAVGQPFPKNWAYGFTGIYSKGYFFIPAKDVKAVEFGVELQ